MWTSTNGESIWSMARWRWRSSTAWSKERSSSRSKERLTVPLWPKARKIRPERRSRQLLPYFCAHRRPDRNPTPGSLSIAILVPFFAATDIGLPIDRRKLHTQIETAAPQRVAQPPYLVRGEDHEGNRLVFGRPQFGYRDLPFRKDFEQQGFEAFIYLVDFVDQQYARPLVQQRSQQRPLDKEI